MSVVIDDASLKDILRPHDGIAGNQLICEYSAKDSMNERCTRYLKQCVLCRLICLGICTCYLTTEGTSLRHYGRQAAPYMNRICGTCQ